MTSKIDIKLFTMAKPVVRLRTFVQDMLFQICVVVFRGLRLRRYPQLSNPRKQLDLGIAKAGFYLLMFPCYPTHSTEIQTVK